MRNRQGGGSVARSLRARSHSIEGILGLQTFQGICCGAVQRGWCARSPRVLKECQPVLGCEARSGSCWGTRSPGHLTLLVADTGVPLLLSGGLLEIGAGHCRSTSGCERANGLPSSPANQAAMVWSGHYSISSPVVVSNFLSWAQPPKQLQPLPA